MSSRTPNINLEKPSSDENYSISVFNGNSDTIDTEMALRVKTADIINNLTSTATNKPLSAAQGKALNDAKVNVSDIQNNLTSTATNKPLSAAQGKALSDTINTFLSRFKEKVTYINTLQSDNDLNKLVKTGMYQTNGTTSTPAAPFSNPALVLVLAGGASSDYRILQIMTRSNSIADESVYYRKCYGDPTVSSNWSEWKKLVTEDDLEGTSIDITNDVKTRTGATSTCSCYASKVGNMKHINLNIRVGASYTPNVQAAQDNIIAVLPVDYRPVRKCYMTTVAQDGTNYIVSVEANGNFMIDPSSITSTFLRLSFPIY